MPQAVPEASLLPAAANSPAPLARRVAAAHSVFFNWSLSLTTPLLGHSMFCPHVVDVTDTDFDAKAALQLCLDPAGRNLRVSRTYLDEPRLHWLGQLVRMAVAIIQERQLRFLLVASQLSQTVGGGARHVQPALGNC